MVLTQTSQNGLPLTPHHYPGWISVFVTFIVSMTIYAVLSVPACLVSTVPKKLTDEIIKKPPNTLSSVFIIGLAACLKVINHLSFLGTRLLYALGISQLLPYFCGFYQS